MGFTKALNSWGDATTSAESADSPALPGMMSPEVQKTGNQCLEDVGSVPGMTNIAIEHGHLVRGFSH